MSIFDTFAALFGAKPPERAVEFSTWEDTTPPEADSVLSEPELVNPAAAWPFPKAGDPHPDASEPEVTEEETKPLIVNTNKLAQYHAEQAVQRRATKAELKEIVQAAPEHGIEFVHVGTTTFAWRYHSDCQEYVANRRVIDIATAVCNPTDQFAKWHGSAIAAKNMLAGRYITLRVDAGFDSPRRAILAMGSVTLTDSEAEALEEKLLVQDINTGTVKGWD